MNHLLISALKKVQAWLEAHAHSAAAPLFTCTVSLDAASPTRYTWRACLHQRAPNADTAPDARYSAHGCTLQEAILNLVAAIETDA